MDAVARLARRFIGQRSGTAAVEYAIVAAGIALAIVVVVASVGGVVNTRADRTEAGVEAVD